MRVVVECLISVSQMRLYVANFLEDQSLNHWVVSDGKLILVQARQSQTTEKTCSMYEMSTLMKSSFRSVTRG